MVLNKLTNDTERNRTFLHAVTRLQHAAKAREKLRVARVREAIKIENKIML
jgi:hypothetical protein